MTSIPLYLTSEYACSYLANKTARNCFIHPSTPLTTELYSELIRHGFRRNGSQIYRPQCGDCTACTPLRIPVQTFKPSRNQKRTRKINKLTRNIIKAVAFEPRHYQLYQRYQNARHANGFMANVSPNDYMNFLASSWCETPFIEFSYDTELVAIAVVDYLYDALSAVYTFFDPKFSHLSPGRYAVLWQIDYAQELGLQWLYLGFWIADCQKMSYKNQYRPIQALVNNQWQQYDLSQDII